MIAYGNWPLLLIKSNSIRSFFFQKEKKIYGHSKVGDIHFSILIPLIL